MLCLLLLGVNRRSRVGGPSDGFVLALGSTMSRLRRLGLALLLREVQGRLAPIAPYLEQVFSSQTLKLKLEVAS